MDSQSPQLDESVADSGLPAIEQAFVSRWQRLVSNTNWEKGRIIQEWRTALVTAGCSLTEFADERWGEHVGGVSPQHVGRLRRVFERFGDTHDHFGGLYWSHFQAALDWEDAEMWLEGAVHNTWSVAIMRRTRSETLGLVADGNSNGQHTEEAEVDEDFVAAPSYSEHDASDETASVTGRAGRASASASHANDDVTENRDDEDLDDGDLDESSADNGAMIYAEDGGQETISFVQPFEGLADLPPDFAEAFDGLKLAILRHKSEGWLQLTLDDVIASLDALKQLARAPYSSA